MIKFTDSFGVYNYIFYIIYLILLNETCPFGEESKNKKHQNERDKYEICNI